MTKTTHKNQVGQAGTGVNGGEFAKKTQTDDTITLTAPVSYRAAKAELRAAEEALEAAEDRVMAANVGVVAGRLRDLLPTGTTARFTGNSVSPLQLAEVSDGNGDLVYRHSYREADVIAPAGVSVRNVQEFVYSHLNEIGETRKLLKKLPGASPHGITHTLTLR